MFKEAFRGYYKSRAQRYIRKRLAIAKKRGLKSMSFYFGRFTNRILYPAQKDIGNIMYRLRQEGYHIQSEGYTYTVSWE